MARRRIRMFDAYHMDLVNDKERASEYYNRPWLVL
jgi:hypothetical protein